MQPIEMVAERSNRKQTNRQRIYSIWPKYNDKSTFAIVGSNIIIKRPSSSSSSLSLSFSSSSISLKIKPKNMVTSHKRPTTTIPIQLGPIESSESLRRDHRHHWNSSSICNNGNNSSWSLSVMITMAILVTTLSPSISIIAQGKSIV